MSNSSKPQEIKIFISSSINEFKEERKQVTLLFDKLNNISVKKGVYFHVVRSEDLSVAMNPHRKQEEYNRKIEECKYFFMFIGKKLGAYTREEFDVAWDILKNSEKYPIIYPFFITKGKPGEDVREFVTYLQEKLNHFTNEYTNFDAVLLNIALELVEKQELGSVAFLDGQAILEKQELVPLSEIPIYSHNEELKRVNMELNEVNNEYLKLVEDDSGDITGKVRNKLDRVIMRRKGLYDRRKQIEDAICENYNKIVNSKNTNPYEEKAMSLMNQGKVRDALIILRDEQFEAETNGIISRLKSQTENPKAEIESYISAQKYLISVLKTTGLNDEKVEEIKNIYDKLVSLAIEWHLSPEILFEYVVFLRKYSDFEKSIYIAEKLEAYYKLFGCADEQRLAELYMELGIINYDNRRFEDSKKYFKSAIELCDRNNLSPGILIELYNWLGKSNWKLNHMNESEKHLKQAEKLLKDTKVATESGEIFYKEQLAHNHNCFGLIYRAMERYEFSLRHHRKAASIRKELMEMDFEEYAFMYTESCNNIAFAYRSINRIDKAILSMKECINVREKLLNYDPEFIRPKLGTTYTNAGMFYIIADRLGDAERYLKKAMEIRRIMCEKYPEKFNAALALSYNRYANWLLSMKKAWEAEEYLNKAFELMDKYVEKEYDAHIKCILQFKVTFAKLNLSRGNYLLAEKNCRDAIGLRDEMIKREVQQDRRINLIAFILLAYSMTVNKKTEEAAVLIQHELEEYSPLHKSDKYAKRAFLGGTSLLRINLAIIRMQQGETRTAREILLQVIEDFKIVADKSDDKYSQMKDYIETLYNNSSFDSSDFNTKFFEITNRFRQTYNSPFEEYDILKNLSPF